MTPVHEHDCGHCTYIASFPLRHPYIDDEDGYRTGTPFKWVGMGDLYRSCDGSGYEYIVRYGHLWEYATTNVPSRYLKVAWVDAVDPYESPVSFIFDEMSDSILDEPLSEDIFADPPQADLDGRLIDR